MKTDIEIAEEATLQPITAIAAELGVAEDHVEQYGKYKAKICGMGNKQGKLVLVTAINPTASGEGKTTVSIGLADSLKKIGANVVLALREPSLGPVFGIKGGATGGGMAQIAPMADINLHFTGDLHAITAANNLLSSMIDNHMYFGNALRIRNVVWRRCLDCNDRALRNIVVGMGFPSNGCVREDGFNITAASEVMAVLCLARDLDDLKARLARIVIGYDYDGNAVTCGDLKAQDAMAILLKDALKPNLVQTLEGVPAIVHGGPFANIAHGCNTVIATKTALSYADYVITEAGFGADLGAEKFLDIKCRVAELKPSCVVLVATVRALKSAGGVPKQELSVENTEALLRGMGNLAKHIENMKGFGLPVVVAINRFVTDTQKELDAVRDYCLAVGAQVEPCDIWAKGGDGGRELATAVKKIVDEGNPTTPRYTYDLTQSLTQKIEAVATKIYGAAKVAYLPAAVKQIKKLEENGFGELPVCVAKTQYSLSDNPTLTGRPTDFTITVREVQLRAGAGFIVAVAGDIMLMPGLSKVPNAVGMKIDSDGKISGLF